MAGTNSVSRYQTSDSSFIVKYKRQIVFFAITIMLLGFGFNFLLIQISENEQVPSEQELQQQQVDQAVQEFETRLDDRQQYQNWKTHVFDSSLLKYPPTWKLIVPNQDIPQAFYFISGDDFEGDESYKLHLSFEYVLGYTPEASLCPLEDDDLEAKTLSQNTYTARSITTRGNAYPDLDIRCFDTSTKEETYGLIQISDFEPFDQELAEQDDFERMNLVMKYDLDYLNKKDAEQMFKTFVESIYTQ